nr:MAG TPA: YopX protein [Caudoviricetes sp.]
MRPLIYKGLRLGINKTEWVSSDEIKQSYSQIRLLAVENDTYAWVPIEDGTLCRGSEAKDTLGKRIYEKDHIEFDCKSVQETPLVAEVYYSTDKFQWRCKAINQQDTLQHDAVLDFDLAFVLNNGKVKVVGNRLEGYEHE